MTTNAKTGVMTWCEHIKWQDKSTHLADFCTPGFYISEQESGESLIYEVPKVWNLCPICGTKKPEESKDER